MIVDLFAGPGGWDEGLRLLGRDDVVGLEMDWLTCRTRKAAGHATICTDVTQYPPSAFGSIEGLIASPPCQTFSLAGKQRGLEDLRGWLVFEVLRWTEALAPRWIACENVPPVLEIWRAFTPRLRKLGYQVWAGVLNAADFGVPQSRKRAFLLASLDGLQLPTPTHAAVPPEPDLFGTRRRERWVTMAEALGWPTTPPDDLTSWAWRRPATTVVRSFCPTVISAPGYRTVGDGPRQKAPGSLTVSFDDLCRLQAVSPDYPFHGPKTKRESLAGAFLPPPWAAAILAPLIDASARQKVPA